MKILSIECSAKASSVCLIEDGKIQAEYFQQDVKTHSRTIMPMVETLLKNCEIAVGDIDVLAVSNGPGSFTGIRIGVSVIKGLAFANDTKCCGVSSLEAMAYCVSDVVKHGVVCALMDARRGQYYNALFRIADGKIERLCDDRAISYEDLKNELLSLNEKCFFVGDGAIACAEYIKDGGIDIELMPQNMIMQRAYGVGMLAFNKKQYISANELMPIYLRPPQAERERNK